MKFFSNILFCLCFFLNSNAQTKETYNKCTIISLGGTEALVYNGDLKQKEQIRYINIDDEVNIERIRHKIYQKSLPLWLIIKPSDSIISITKDYQNQVNKYLGPAKKLTVESLNNKEKEILAIFKKEYPNGF